jgi:hypothetical protein
MAVSLDGSRFWTPQKLNALVVTLRQLAKEDGRGLYLGPEGLAKSVVRVNPGEFKSLSNISGGVIVLVSLGILEKGRPSTKPSNYRRRFYPDALGREITWADIQQYADTLKPRPGKR